MGRMRQSARRSELPSPSPEPVFVISNSIEALPRESMTKSAEDEAERQAQKSHLPTRNSTESNRRLEAPPVIATGVNTNSAEKGGYNETSGKHDIDSVLRLRRHHSEPAVKSQDYTAGKHEEPTNTSDETSESLAPLANFKGSFVGHQAVTPTYTHTPFFSRFTTGWTDLSIYKGAIIEFVATTLIIYINGLMDVTINNMQSKYFAAFAAVANIFLLTLFIMAAGPGSGGHLNPTITFATACVGLTEVPRGVVYLIAQLVGAATAGGALRGALGKQESILQNGGGCFIIGDAMDPGQTLLNESLSTLALLFIAFGVGLDPRQARLFGAIIGPLAVGCGLALVVFANAGFREGYTGASMNPARCFAFAVARGGFGDQWVWWAGPVIGGVVHAGVYLVCPPYDSRPKRVGDSFV